MDVFGIWNLDEGYRVQIQTDQDRRSYLILEVLR